MSTAETTPNPGFSKQIVFGIQVPNFGWVIVWLVVCCLQQGCQFGGSFNIMPQRAVPQQCALPPEMTKEEVISHLNQNVNRLKSWRSTHVQISTAGMPIKLSAVIAVEQPRNFRLRAGLVTGNEADFGSNPDRFWFWMRRSPDKYVLTSSHADAGQVQQMMKLPFEPSWLMEALGVIPLEASEFEMLPAAAADGVMSLIADRVTEAGEPVRRVIQVDTCQGYIVAHELYDAQNRLIARAELNDYKLDKPSGVTLPHRVNLDWPQARLALTMTIGAIEVNPPHIPEQTWKIPKIPGYPVLDLGRVTRRGQPPGRARVSSGNTIREIPPREVDPATGDGTGRESQAPAAARLVQTAEVPPWENSTGTDGWHPPVDRTASDQSIELVADHGNDEPPWDDGSTDSARVSLLPNPGQVGGSSIRGVPPFAGANEEPPWDQSSATPAVHKDTKPASVFDFFKAPFARMMRRK